MINSYSINDCPLIALSQLGDRHGHLTVVENNDSIPFEVRRVYYLYDIPGGESRGAHGHKFLESLIIAVSGSFDVTLDDGQNKKTVQLNRPYHALNVKPGMWRDIHNFSAGAVCLVLASLTYEVEDYIRDYDEFLKLKKV